MRLMKIGELARATGVEVSTIRYYERVGLMPKPATRESGYREYSEGDLDRLRLIVAAKRQRFPLSLILVLLNALDDPEPCQEIASLVRGRVSVLDREIAELQELRLRLAGQLRAWNLGTLPKADCLCAILQTDALTPTKEKEEDMPKIEVFVAGCPLCDEAVKTVNETKCDGCTVEAYDLREGCSTNACRAKAEAYGIARVPAVEVDGRLLDCCQGSGKVSSEALRAAGVGSAA